MIKIANKQQLPFPVEIPTAETQKAIIKLKSGKGKAFQNADALFKDLGI
ncbi:hypothetical protein [Zymomonas mobilis]|nr:hypothetical protein [Zymomonas mobilis]MDX5947802.1 hypothetical protein [Zymomonas mobilis subsp. pomaceae]